MIRYKLMGNNDIENPISSLLKTRGIEGEELQTFFQVGQESLIDPFKLNNMLEACQTVHNNLGKKIFTLVDCDTDGFTSAAMLVNFLETELKQEVDYYVHSDKTHGLQPEVMEKIISGGYELVYFADAGSNDVEQCKELSERGIKVVILDHHESCENPYAIVVNNQLSEKYSNKSFSGAGIVWKFICAYCSSYPQEVRDCANDYLDLLALGNVADAMDMRSNETRYLILQGFKNVRNTFFKAMCAANAYSMSNKVTPMSVAWYVAPTINAVCRFGEIDDKRELFASMLDRNAAVMVPSDKRGAKGQDELLVERVVRHSKNVKKHQDDAVKLAQTAIDKMIEEKGLLKHKLLFVQVDEKMVKSEIAGLLANKLASKYQQPTLVGRVVEGNRIAGSGRNFGYSPVESFRETLLETGLVEFAQGHASAFGFAISSDNVDKLIEKMDVLWENMNFTQEYPVDFELDMSEVDSEKAYRFVMMLGEVCEKGLWGNGLSEPYVVFKNVKVGSFEATLLSPNKKPTLKIEKSYCTFMKFGSSQEEANQFAPSFTQSKTLDIIGTVNLNNYNNKITPQLFIKAYDMTEDWNF